MKPIVLLFALLLPIMSFHSHRASAQTQPTRTLVAYFSATGTTRAVAELIADCASADLFAIEPREPYTSADLNWNDRQSRSSLEMDDPDARPALKSTVSNIQAYDTLYIGFPIWWYVAPRIINSFVEAHDLRGKVLIPFATSGGSRIEGAVKALRASYPDLNWKDGRLLNGANRRTVSAWIGE